MHSAIVFQPADKRSPSCIMDRFSKFPIAYHIADLKVFIGDQIVRSDVRVCRLSGKILTLPLDLQMLLGKCFSGFLSISRFLLFLGEPSLETFEPLLSFAIVSGILDCLPFRVRQVRFQTDINSQLLARW